MSPVSQSKRGRVLYSGKIDGGASRALEMPDGSLKVETWGPEGWVEGGASLGEFMLAPPISPAFAARLGTQDLEEGADESLVSPDRNKGAARFKPDYGLRLLKDGYSPTADLYFYEFRLHSISVLGSGDYSTMVEQRYEGEMHALSLDFNQAQLEKILVGADPQVAAFARAELSKDPISARTIELDRFVSFAARARLGCLETGSTNEQFVPLVAQEIL